MTSILTNVAAQTALRSLQATNAALETTQGRISTGLKIGEASDSAAYWSIATTMRSDNSALSTVKTSLDTGANTVDSAYQGLKAVQGELTNIKNRLLDATKPDAQIGELQDEIDASVDSIKGFAESSGQSGVNWLSVDSGEAGYSSTTEFVSSFSRASDGSISIGKIEVDHSDAALFDAGGDGLLETSASSAAKTLTNLAWTGGGFNADTDDIAMVVDVDGSEQTVNLTFDSAEINSETLARAINNSSLSGATASVNQDGDLVLTTNETGSDVALEVKSFTPNVSMGDAATLAFGDLSSVQGSDDSGVGIGDIDLTSATQQQINGWINMVDDMQGAVTSAAAGLGASMSRMDTQSGFIDGLMDTLDRNISTLVDADMTAESTRLQALQVQQQLGIQALGIANSNAQSVLGLFG